MCHSHLGKMEEDPLPLPEKSDFAEFPKNLQSVLEHRLLSSSLQVQSHKKSTDVNGFIPWQKQEQMLVPGIG